MPAEQVTGRHPLDRLDRLLRDPVTAYLIMGRERVGRKLVSVESAGPSPVQPAALDDVDAGSAALAEEPLPVGRGDRKSVV